MRAACTARKVPINVRLFLRETRQHHMRGAYRIVTGVERILLRKRAIVSANQPVL